MKTVLIAAERDLEHNLLSEALGSQGYAITRSRDGLSALETARANPPRVLIANVSLPRMDGFSLFRRWQADELLHHIPVILYSPRSTDDKSARFAAELGATRFIANALKPDGGLLRAVEEALSASPKPAPAVAEKSATSAGQSEARARQNKAAQIISIEARQLRERIGEQQETLKALEEKLAFASAQSALFMANPLAMWVIDKRTRRMLAVNPAALQLFGYTEAEFLMLTADNLVRAQGTLPMATNVMGYQHKHGHALSLLLASSDIHYNGVAAELIAVNDVSHRVRGERAVVEEAQRVKAILAAMPLPYWMMDEQGRLLDVNEQLCRLTGYRRGELLGVTVDGLVPEANEVQQLLTAAPAQNLSITLKHQEGRSLPVDILIGQSEFSRTRMALVRERVEQVAPATADTIITGPQQNARLTAALEILRYAEDASEATLLHYATAQIAAAFDSPIALFAEAESITQTFTIGALCNAQNNKRNTIAGPQLLPAEWQVLFKQRRTLAVDGFEQSEQPQLTLPNGIELARYMVCPINGRDGDVWLLLVGNRESAYGLAEQAELMECGEVLATVLKRERQQLKVRNSQQKAENLGKSMVMLLGKLLDHHDAYAAGSGNRVAALAVLFAQKLDLSAERQHALSIAARLHDVGHLLLPQSLLLRPSTFSDGERALMQGHAEQGAQLLRGIEFGVEVASIVHQHHERMDGSGYPQKLKGEDILLEARILAVADVLEALCAARPYRAARSLQEALTILNEGSGTLYDADVVAACNELCGNGAFVWPV